MHTSRLLALTVGLAAALTAAPITIFNTGTTAPGTVDPNWTITAPAASAGSAFVTTEDGFPIGPWLANSGTSRWIQPDSATADAHAANTTFVFRTTFSLTGLTPASAELIFAAASDNQITAVRLNGNTVGYTSAGFGAFSGNFSVTTDAWFAAGLNILEFDLLNLDGGIGNPAGLRVEITGTADAISSVPEPATFLLAAPALAAMYLRRRRAA